MESHLRRYFTKMRRVMDAASSPNRLYENLLHETVLRAGKIALPSWQTFPGLTCSWLILGLMLLHQLIHDSIHSSDSKIPNIHDPAAVSISSVIKHDR